jgi:hypothetical protein
MGFALMLMSNWQVNEGNVVIDGGILAVIGRESSNCI